METGLVWFVPKMTRSLEFLNLFFLLLHQHQEAESSVCGRVDASALIYCSPAACVCRRPEESWQSIGKFPSSAGRLATPSSHATLTIHTHTHTRSHPGLWNTETAVFLIITEQTISSDKIAENFSPAAFKTLWSFAASWFWSCSIFSQFVASAASKGAAAACVEL